MQKTIIQGKSKTGWMQFDGEYCLFYKRRLLLAVTATSMGP